MFTPGAVTWGASEPVSADGPRLEKVAILPVELFTAPTMSARSSLAPGVSVMVPHAAPVLPAPATFMMPAALSVAMTGTNSWPVQPSMLGHAHEWLITSGARVGSPSTNGSPPTGYGARKNSKHSR